MAAPPSFTPTAVPPGFVSAPKTVAAGTAGAAAASSAFGPPNAVAAPAPIAHTIRGILNDCLSSSSKRLVAEEALAEAYSRSAVELCFALLQQAVAGPPPAPSTPPCPPHGSTASAGSGPRAGAGGPPPSSASKPAFHKRKPPRDPVPNFAAVSLLQILDPDRAFFGRRSDTWSALRAHPQAEAFKATLLHATLERQATSDPVRKSLASTLACVVNMEMRTSPWSAAVESALRSLAPQAPVWALGSALLVVKTLLSTLEPGACGSVAAAAVPAALAILRAFEPKLTSRGEPRRAPGEPKPAAIVTACLGVIAAAVDERATLILRKEDHTAVISAASVLASVDASGHYVDAATSLCTYLKHAAAAAADDLTPIVLVTNLVVPIMSIDTDEEWRRTLLEALTTAMESSSTCAASIDAARRAVEAATICIFDSLLEEFHQPDSPREDGSVALQIMEDCVMAADAEQSVWRIMTAVTLEVFTQLVACFGSPEWLKWIKPRGKEADVARLKDIILGRVLIGVISGATDADGPLPAAKTNPRHRVPESIAKAAMALVSVPAPDVNVRTVLIATASSAATDMCGYITTDIARAVVIPALMHVAAQPGLPPHARIHALDAYAVVCEDEREAVVATIPSVLKVLQALVAESDFALRISTLVAMAAAVRTAGKDFVPHAAPIFTAMAGVVGPGLKTPVTNAASSVAEREAVTTTATALEILSALTLVCPLPPDTIKSMTQAALFCVAQVHRPDGKRVSTDDPRIAAALAFLRTSIQVMTDEMVAELLPATLPVLASCLTTVNSKKPKVVRDPRGVDLSLDMPVFPGDPAGDSGSESDDEAGTSVVPGAAEAVYRMGGLKTKIMLDVFGLTSGKMAVQVLAALCRRAATREACVALGTLLMATIRTCKVSIMVNWSIDALCRTLITPRVASMPDVVAGLAEALSDEMLVRMDAVDLSRPNSVFVTLMQNLESVWREAAGVSTPESAAQFNMPRFGKLWNTALAVMKRIGLQLGACEAPGPTTADIDKAHLVVNDALDMVLAALGALPPDARASGVKTLAPAIRGMLDSGQDWQVSSGILFACDLPDILPSPTSETESLFLAAMMHAGRVIARPFWHEADRYSFLQASVFLVGELAAHDSPRFVPLIRDAAAHLPRLVLELAEDGSASEASTISVDALECVRATAAMAAGKCIVVGALPATKDALHAWMIAFPAFDEADFTKRETLTQHTTGARPEENPISRTDFRRATAANTAFADWLKAQGAGVPALPGLHEHVLPACENILEVSGRSLTADARATLTHVMTLVKPSAA